MTTEVLLLGSGPARPVSAPREVRDAYVGLRRAATWLVTRATPLQHLAGVVRRRGAPHVLVLLERVAPEHQAFLRAAFREVVDLSAAHTLPPDELVDALTAPHRGELFVAGVLDRRAEVLVLYRAEPGVPPVVVPMPWFTPSGDGVAPDFDRFAVADHGATVRLGDYEASTGAILYEFDAVYRREAKRRLRERSGAWGDSLRRLRLQKGVARDGFLPDISEKQIARLERGETSRPRAATLEAIAARLGVRPGEIGEY